jgi:hypothetical protein
LLTRQRTALKNTKEALVNHPRLRHEVAELEGAIDKLTQEVETLQTAFNRESNIRDGAVKLIAEFPTDKLRKLEREEQLLEGSGTKPFPARLPSE